MKIAKILCLSASTIVTAACSYPKEVRTVASLTNSRVALLQTEASAQAAGFKEARVAAKERAQRLHALHQVIEEINFLPEADIRDAALSAGGKKAVLAHYNVLRANDVALRADPYAFLQAPKLDFKTPKAAKLDLSGLAKVLKNLEPMSKRERLTLADILTYATAVNQELAALEAERSKLAGAENSND
ncbi:MAG: hypothetical protein ACPGVA_10675 [Pikeienuella sp.]